MTAALIATTAFGSVHAGWLKLRQLSSCAKATAVPIASSAMSPGPCPGSQCVLPLGRQQSRKQSGDVVHKDSVVFSRVSGSLPQWTVIALLLWLGLSGPSRAQESASPETEPRTTVASNIRAGPGLQYSVLRVLPAGTAVQFTAQSPDGSWLQLQQDGSWIFAALVQPVPLSLPVVGGTAAAPSSPPTPGTPWTWDLPDSDTLRAGHLEQINARRAYHGLGALTLDVGQAAQSHALELAQGAYVSHWDRRGLAPYMRYSREGGPGYSQENISLSAYSGSASGACVPDSYDYRQKLEEVLADLLASPEHRDTLLNTHHRQVQLGLARFCEGMVLVQVLITDLVTWSRLPRIEGNLLILEGVASSPARITEDLQVLLAWEPLPQPYTVPQLSQTRCYSQPRYVAAAVKRNRPGAQVRVTATHCLTPAQTDPNATSPTRPAQPSAESYLIPLLQRDRWDAYGPRFTLRLAVGDLLATYGEGIYTVSLRGRIGSTSGLLGQYAVVVGARPDLW